MRISGPVLQLKFSVCVPRKKTAQVECSQEYGMHTLFFTVSRICLYLRSCTTEMHTLKSSLLRLRQQITLKRYFWTAFVLPFASKRTLAGCTYTAAFCCMYSLKWAVNKTSTWLTAPETHEIALLNCVGKVFILRPIFLFFEYSIRYKTVFNKNI